MNQPYYSTKYSEYKSWRFVDKESRVFSPIQLKMNRKAWEPLSANKRPSLADENRIRSVDWLLGWSFSTLIGRRPWSRLASKKHINGYYSHHQRKKNAFVENLARRTWWAMEGVAKFDFRANQEDEISFRANEILKILQLDEVRENHFHRKGEFTRI